MVSKLLFLRGRLMKLCILREHRKESQMSNGEAVYGFYIPTVTLMGIGAHKQICAQMKSLGVNKPFIVADKGITAAGITAKICDLIKTDMGSEAVVYDDTVPNPTERMWKRGWHSTKKADVT